MTSNTVNPTMLKQQQSTDTVTMESNKKQGGYMHSQNQHSNHYNGNNQRGYNNNNHSNNFNGNRRTDKKKQNNNNHQNNNNANTNNNNNNNYQYVQGNEGAQVIDPNYYNAAAVGDEHAIPAAYHYYPIVQPQPIFYTHAADAPYYSTTQAAPIQAAGSPTPVGIYPQGSVITVANPQNLQVPNRVMTTINQIPCYSTNQMGAYSPQQQQAHPQRYNRHHNNNRRSQGPSSSASSNSGSHYSTTNTSSTTTNIYVSGLSASTTDESFADMCKNWGKIISSKAIINNETNECKGFGFVMYENEEQARNAIEQLNNRGYHVSFAKDSLSARLKNLQDEDSTNIYISNIPFDMTEEQFLELFAPHNVLSHTILKDQSGNSRGVGFARFESRAIAKEIIDKYNNVKLEGGANPLQVRFADSNAQKKLKEQVANKKYSSTPKIKYQNNIPPPEQMITYSYYGSPVMPPTSPLPMQAQIIPQNFYPGMLSPMIAPASPSLIYIENMTDNGSIVESYDSQPENSGVAMPSSPTNDPKMDKLSMNMQNKLRINDENVSIGK